MGFAVYELESGVNRCSIVLGEGDIGAMTGFFFSTDTNQMIGSIVFDEIESGEAGRSMTIDDQSKVSPESAPVGIEFLSLVSLNTLIFNLVSLQQEWLMQEAREQAAKGAAEQSTPQESRQGDENEDTEDYTFTPPSVVAE